MSHYKIERYYEKHNATQFVEDGLTEDEAKEYCRSPESSSRTCKKPENKKFTKMFGKWIAGFVEVKDDNGQ